MKHSSHILAGWLVDGSGEPIRQHILTEVKGETLVGCRAARREDYCSLTPFH